MLQDIIKSKTRINLLVKFFTNIDNFGHLSSLASEFNESTNSVRKELNNLTKAKILKKKIQKNKVIYSANQNHPLFNNIQKLIFNHLGIEHLIERIIENIGDIKKVFLVGDYAKGIDSGTIEVIIKGNNLDINYLKNLERKIEKKINRKVIIYASNSNYDKGLLIFDFQDQ
tara:strand:+ start:3444 stop:3956 length:513 start_codon:yes stop_codon:yes gene_type:complete